jgi:hypothetical protein
MNEVKQPQGTPARAVAGNGGGDERPSSFGQLH